MANTQHAHHAHCKETVMHTNRMGQGMIDRKRKTPITLLLLKKELVLNH